MRAMKHLLIGFMFVFLLADCLSFAKNPAAGSPGVILFQHPNYMGRSILITGEVRALDAPNFRFNNKAASLKLVGGARSVALYRLKDFQGQCQTFTHDVPSLIGTTIGVNRVSSVKVNGGCQTAGTGSSQNTMARTERGVYLYQHPDFKGASVKVVGEVADLRDGRYNFNNKASAVKLVGNVSRVAVWKDANFVGDCETLTRDFPSLAATTVGNNNVSSLIVDQDCNCKKYIKVKNTGALQGLRVKIFRAQTNQSVLLHQKYLNPAEVFAVSFPRENPGAGVDVIIESTSLGGFVKMASVWCKLNDSHEFKYDFGWGAIMHRWGPPWHAWEPVGK